MQVFFFYICSCTLDFITKALLSICSLVSCIIIYLCIKLSALGILEIMQVIIYLCNLLGMPGWVHLAVMLGVAQHLRTLPASRELDRYLEFLQRRKHSGFHLHLCPNKKPAKRNNTKHFNQHYNQPARELKPNVTFSHLSSNVYVCALRQSMILLLIDCSFGYLQGAMGQVRRFIWQGSSGVRGRGMKVVWG